jgi:SAM-dependent methyltransferase
VNPEEYEKMFAVEDRHWWFAGKRKLVGVLLDRARLPKDAKILDVGCGTGGMELLLHRYGRVTAIDASPLALSFAKRRGLAELRRAQLPNLPFADASFDLVGIFDVLYHRNVGDDAAGARELLRVLKPGGVLVVTDSALGFLAGPHDVAMHGARRYSAHGIRELLASAGFAVERAGYGNFLLFPLAAPWRLLQRWSGAGAGSGHSDVSPAPAWVNGLLGLVYGAEARLLRWFDLPIGTSILALARKP